MGMLDCGSRKIRRLGLETSHRVEECALSAVWLTNKYNIREIILFHQRSQL